jgi:hypothetical protein
MWILEPQVGKRIYQGERISEQRFISTLLRETAGQQRKCYCLLHHVLEVET